jgi:YidC/Oxa1 family membrane protein insertase
MDRNTTIGLIIIGVILSVFSIFNQPSEAEIKQQEKKIALQKKKEAEAKKNKSEKNTDKKSSGGQSSNDKGEGKQTKISSIQKEVKGELVRLENDKIIIDFNTKGGMVAAVYLKEFESYSDYANKSSKKVKKPLRLFSDGDALNQLVFTSEGQKIYTSGYLFSVKNMTKESITFERDFGNGKTIEQEYKLKKGAYDLDYDIHIEGWKGSKNYAFNWKTAYRKTERLFSEQRRVSTVCFDYKNEDFDYLSEMGSDFQRAEDDVNWISFKQSYFSSFVRPENGFTKKDTKFQVHEYDEKDDKEWKWSHLKDYNATGGLKVKNPDNETISMNWFFGPNDYETLKAYNQGYDDILNFGWGLFRWINLYAVQPLFNMLASTGMSLGIAILMLTLILKFVLMPIQWKMYVSSAKMRILKPEIDELNAKYPEKEDAMKKQMEMMTLYRESGASPLAGCLPMLIQMPILLAVFRFFPSAFELRQKPFLWAEDLSSYDSIWNFGINIWPYGDHVSLFTLLMAGTTLLYTYMNSGNMQQPQQPGMPNMKVIMYVFPVMMIFFFNNYSAGLSYYYFISTLVSIIIMLLIKQFFVDEDKLKLKMAERKANMSSKDGKVKKKSKFQERLEQMQKAQMEQMKNKKK